MVNTLYAIGKLKRMGYRLLQEAGYVDSISKKKVKTPPTIIDGKYQVIKQGWAYLKKVTVQYLRHAEGLVPPLYLVVFGWTKDQRFLDWIIISSWYACRKHAKLSQHVE